jgi:phosphonate transport system permease protein
MSFAGLFGGFSDVAALIARMLPPDFYQLSGIISATIETLWMALLGTTIAVLISFPLSFGAAKNTTPNKFVFALCRGIITMTRAIPDLIFAAIFVRAFGIGPLAGILALGLHSIGMIGKMFADALENADAMPREASVSTGASKWQAIFASILPQATPTMIGTSLYRLDINVRASAVLGLVGAGGIGFIIQSALRSLDYPSALAAVSVIFIVILAIEFFSSKVRASILGERSASVVVVRSQSERSIRRTGRDRTLLVDAVTMRSLVPPLTSDRKSRIISVWVYVIMLAIALGTINMPIFSSFGYFDDAWRIVAQLVPPDFTTARSELITGMSESLAIAFISTTLGLFIAIPLGLLSSRNIVVRKMVFVGTRSMLVVFRGIPELIIAVLFVSAMGLGPVPGTLALTLVTAFFMSKLIADTFEEVDPSPREAIFATGATRIQELFGSVLPQAMPALVSQILYMLDVNLRSSTVLGIVGGGGIGFLLLGSIRVFEFGTTGAVVFSIFVVVYAIELVGSWVRGVLDKAN